jgi:hypothetical protein
MGSFISKKPEMNDVSTDTYGLLTELDIAILDNNFLRVKYLVENEQPLMHNSSLLIAGKIGHVKILKYLRKHYFMKNKN